MKQLQLLLSVHDLMTEDKMSSMSGTKKTHSHGKTWVRIGQLHETKWIKSNMQRVAFWSYRFVNSLHFIPRIMRLMQLPCIWCIFNRNRRGHRAYSKARKNNWRTKKILNEIGKPEKEEKQINWEMMTITYCHNLHKTNCRFHATLDGWCQKQ